MIRVLHTIDTTGPGGAETVFINLVKGLDSKRFESVVAIRGPGWVCDSLRIHGVEPIFVPSRGGFNFKYLLSLVRIIKDRRIDVIQSHLLGSNLYCSLAGLICNIPVISTFHGFVDTSKTERLVNIKMSVINKGSKNVVFVSEKLKVYYVNNFNISANKAIVIYNGVDIDVFKPKKDETIRNKLNLNSGHVLIGALGNVRRAKGYDVFLKSAQMIHDKHPESRFVIAGEGSGKLYESLIKLRNELGLEKVFHMIGFQSDPAKVLNNLDIFVLPSVSEGFSISTIEAMACGVPVVVTRSGGPEEVVTDGETGEIVACSESELCKAILKIINNKYYIEKYVDNSILVVNKKYSLSRMIRKYEEIYRKKYEK